MDGYTTAPGTESYTADAGVAEGNGWYGGEAQGQTVEAVPEQQGFSIPTTGQANGGGPMRQGRGTSRFNPMGRGKQGGGDGGPASAATAEKNELGYIIFAYNIGYQTDEVTLQSLFSPYGTVAKVNVIQDFGTGQGKGFGFVTMPNAQEAENAVNSLNGTEYNGLTLQIRFKSPKGQGPPPGARGGRGAGFKGTRGSGFRGGSMRGGPRGGGGGGFRGGRGGPRGGGMGGRGRGRGAYSSAPSAYDAYGYQSGGYDQYGYTDPNAGYGQDPYGYAAATDPYAGYGQPPAAGTGYTSYGATGW